MLLCLSSGVLGLNLTGYCAGSVNGQWDLPGGGQ